MKNRSAVLRIAVPIAAALAFVAAAAAQTLSSFSQNFSPGGAGRGETHDVRDYHWQVVAGRGSSLMKLSSLEDSPVQVGIGSGPSVSSTQEGTPAAGSGQANSGFLYVSPRAKAEPRMTMLFCGHLGVSDSRADGTRTDWLRNGTRKLAGLTVGDIDEITVDTKAGSVYTVMRFAIRVDGKWYASREFFKQTDCAAFERRTIHPSTSSWIPGAFDGESSLDEDIGNKPSTPLNRSDEITGYGWLADTYSLSGASASLQITNYRIQLGVLSEPYLQWAMGPFANPLNDSAYLADQDKDGFSNLLEFVMGTDPTAADAPSALPAIGTRGADLVVRFRRSDASELQPARVEVKWGDKPDSAIVVGPRGETLPGGVSYTVNEIGTLDTVVVKIPGAAAASGNVRIVAGLE